MEEIQPEYPNLSHPRANLHPNAVGAMLHPGQTKGRNRQRMALPAVASTVAPPGAPPNLRVPWTLPWP